MGYKHPKKIEKKIIGLPNIPKNIVKVAKNLLGVLWQDELGVKKKSSRKNVNILENALVVTTPPSIKKTHFYSENSIFCYFVQFSLKEFWQNAMD